ncbi:MAG: MTAP family purine nucleoside phosphorylase, partial [Nitrososphaerales archaeon]
MPGERKVAIILGSGLFDLYRNDVGLKASVDTRYGAGEAQELSTNAYLLLRHGPGHSIPPHLINYRANVEALHKLGVQSVIASAAVGAINPRIRVGTYVVLDQFIDETKARVSTFYTEPGEQFSHVDMTHPYSERVRRALIGALRKNRITRFRSSGTYVCTEGPRFETPAEIKMYGRAGGEVVGMTGVPEVCLAKEMGMEYGTLAFVTNMAAGLQKKVSQEEVSDAMSKTQAKTKAVLD